MYKLFSKNPLSIREIVSEHSVFVGTHKILLIFCCVGEESRGKRVLIEDEVQRQH